MPQHYATAIMAALASRTRVIEADEREAASALIVGTCSTHGLARCDDAACEGKPLDPGRGFALYCGGPGQPAVQCESVEAFATAQRGERPTVPYTHAANSTGTTRTRS
jgi:hypothetical protein